MLPYIALRGISSEIVPQPYCQCNGRQRRIGVTTRGKYGATDNIEVVYAVYFAILVNDAVVAVF